MALDSAAKRWSMLQVASGPATYPIVFDPDSSVDAIDRFTLLKLYGGFAASASAVLSGTVTTATETDIVSGGLTIVLTLTNDTWVTTGATFDAQRQNIIDGLTSAGVEATGWNAEVRDKEAVTAVVRTSDTVVTITLSAAAAYDISANETITATIPATALTGAGAVVAIPTFAVSYVAESDETYTGGYARVWKRYRDEEQVRRDRVALGIIPAGEPAELIKEAAAQVVPLLARKRLKEQVREAAELDRLEAITLELITAQREAEQEAYRKMIEELRQFVAVETRNQNAQAVLVMLGML